LLTIGDRKFRNTQDWRSKEKGKKLGLLCSVVRRFAITSKRRNLALPLSFHLCSLRFRQPIRRALAHNGPRIHSIIEGLGLAARARLTLLLEP